MAMSSDSREMDPLLKNIDERTQSFRRNVISVATELKEVRSKLNSKEQLFAMETQTRQVAEKKAKIMEAEVIRLKKSLAEKNGQMQEVASSAEKYLKELEDVRSKLSATQETANESASAAESAQVQCVDLLKELDVKNSLLKEHEDRVQRLEDQLAQLQKDLQTREASQKQLKEEVLRIELEIKEAVAKAGASKDCELRKILEEVSPKNIEKINKHLLAKDEEIAMLRDEIRIMSAHWKFKSKELESQLEKHRRADQELKKRVLKLEFCLQETRSQTRKLQRMGERRDKAIKELKDQLATKQQADGNNVDKQNFWESSSFKLIASMSMLILVVFGKR